MSADRNLGIVAGPRSRWRWWTVVALGALMITPAPWSGVAIAALVAGAVLRGVARRLAERRRASRVRASGAVALGRGAAGATVWLPDAALAAHGVILGASGSGKSTTLARVLTDRIARGLPVVAIDLKGSPSFARTLGDAAAAAGRRCVVFTLDGPAHWNPLGHGNPTELKDRLIATERFTEPHYRRAAERYLQAALTVLAAHHPGRAPTLPEVVALCEPRRLAALARRLPGGTGVVDYVTGLSPDQISAVRGIGTRLAIVTESHVGRWLAPGAAGPEVDLPAALRGDAVVVFSLNAGTYGSLAAQLGTIAVQELVGATGRRLGAPGLPPALVAIDEFSALGADQVLALFARGREAGVSVLLATQELTDLDRAARGLRDQVLGNTALKIVHRQDVPASARAVAEMIGTERVWEEARQVGGRGGALPRATHRPVERPRVHPDAIATLGTGEAIVIAKVPEPSVRVVRVAPPRVIGPGAPGAARAGAAWSGVGAPGVGAPGVGAPGVGAPGVSQPATAPAATRGAGGFWPAGSGPAPPRQASPAGRVGGADRSARRFPRAASRPRPALPPGPAPPPPSRRRGTERD